MLLLMTAAAAELLPAAAAHRLERQQRCQIAASLCLGAVQAALRPHLRCNEGPAVRMAVEQQKGVG
jgi:hypothetical protein